jgi:hypothetical protein
MLPKTYVLQERERKIMRVGGKKIEKTWRKEKRKEQGMGTLASGRLLRR